MFSLICARINGWVNTREAGDLRRNRAHYDVIVRGFWVSIHLIATWLRKINAMDVLSCWILLWICCKCANRQLYPYRWIAIPVGVDCSVFLNNLTQCSRRYKKAYQVIKRQLSTSIIDSIHLIHRKVLYFHSNLLKFFIDVQFRIKQNCLNETISH